MKKNFIVDAVLLVTGIIVTVTGVMLDFHIMTATREARHFLGSIHKYVGYVMAVAAVVHVVWHFDWLKNAFRRIVRR